MLNFFGLSSRRTVRCMHCSSPFVVPGSATTLTCPVCYKRVRVDDVILSGRENHHRLETCGVIVVKRGAKVTADTLASGTGILVEGEVRTRTSQAPSIVIGPEAAWHGDLHTHQLTIEPGGVILGGKFNVKPAASSDDAKATRATAEAALEGKILAKARAALRGA
jgi:cytoskeletal protein CcmA (bactofilin family)